MNRFWKVYQTKLTQAVRRDPESYALTRDETPEAYAEKVALSFSDRTSIGSPRAVRAINIHGSAAFRATARHFGVPCSYDSLGPLAAEGS